MDFYSSWLLIGRENKKIQTEISEVSIKYDKPVNTDQNNNIDAIVTNVILKNICIAGNSARNGNLYSELPSDFPDEWMFEHIAIPGVNQIIPFENKYLLKCNGEWAIFNAEKKEILKTGALRRNSALFASDTKNFSFIHSTLKEYDNSGKLKNKIHIPVAESLGFFDAIRTGDQIIICGYIDYPKIPNGYKQLVFVQSIKDSYLSPPDEDSMVRDIDNEKICAFHDSLKVFPVITANSIYQCFSGGVIVLDHDANVKKVIKSAYRPFLLSSDKKGRLFMLAYKDDELCLVGFTDEGDLLFCTEIPQNVMNTDKPPLIMENDTVIIVSNDACIAFSIDGAVIWEHFFIPSKSPVFPLIYKNTLVAGKGLCLDILSESGEMMSRNIDFIDPFVSGAFFNGTHVVAATGTGLYVFTKK
jgi:hypothetical protein